MVKESLILFEYIYVDPLILTPTPYSLVYCVAAVCSAAQVCGSACHRGNSAATPSGPADLHTNLQGREDA